MTSIIIGKQPKGTTYFKRSKIHADKFLDPDMTQICERSCRVYQDTIYRGAA